MLPYTSSFILFLSILVLAVSVDARAPARPNINVGRMRAASPQPKSAAAPNLSPKIAGSEIASSGGKIRGHLDGSTYIPYNFDNPPRQTYPRIEFTAELTEDFKANFRGGEKDHVDAYRITVSSLVDQSKVNNQDVFQIRLFYDEDFQGDSVTVRNLNPKTGKLIETKFTKVNIDQEITIPASHLGDAVISINAEEKLHCPAFRVRAKSMPPNVWYLIQPDYFVHRSLANATPKTFTSPPDDTVNKRRSGSPVKAGASSADVNSMSQAVSKVMSQSMKSQPYVTKDGKKFRRGLDHLNEESDLHFEMHFPDDYHTTLARRSLSEEGDAYHGPLNEQEVSIKFVSHTYHSIRRRSSSSPENFEVLIEEENALYSSKHHPFMHFQKRSPGFSFGGMFKGIANAGKKAVNAVGDVGKKAVHEVAKVEKVVEKEVVKDAKVVGNEVAKAGRTVARVATDVVHTIEKGAKDLSQHVKEIVKDVAHIVSTTKDKLIDFVHTAAGKLGQFYVSSIQGGFLAVIVDAAKKAITAVIDTVTAAVHLIEGVIKTIIQAIQKLIDYIKFLFNWDDILKAQKVFSYTISQTPVILDCAKNTAPVFSKAMGAFDNAMNKTVSAVKDIMGVAADKFMNIPGVGPLAKFVGSTASGVMSALNNGVKFLLNLLFAGLRKLIDLLPKGPKGFLDKAFNYAQGILPPPGSNELMDKFTNAMPAGFMKSGKMQDLVGQPGALQNALQGSAPALVGMSQQSQEFTATSSGGGRPSKRRRLAKRSEDLHEGVGAEHAHDGGAGSSGNPLKDGMKDFLQQVVTNALSKGIDIPIITPLWKWITKGQDLSLQNFQGLLVAIPSVLVHKIATNKAPVSDVASLTNWNADQLLAFFKSQAEKGFKQLQNQKNLVFIQNWIFPMLSGWTTIMTNAIDILLDEMDPEKNPTMEAFVKWVRLLLETGRDLVNIPKIYSERKLNKLMWQNYAVKIGIEEFRLKFEALKDTLKGTVTGVTDVFHPVGNALDTAKDFGFKSKHENGVSSKTHKAISNIGGASGAIDNAWEKINSYILPFSQTALGIIDLVYMVIACVKYSNVEEKGVFIADMIARASLGMSMALEGPKKVSEDKVYTPLAQAALVYASGGSSIAAATAALKYL